VIERLWWASGVQPPQGDANKHLQHLKHLSRTSCTSPNPAGALAPLWVQTPPAHTAPTAAACGRPPPLFGKGGLPHSPPLPSHGRRGLSRPRCAPVAPCTLPVNAGAGEQVLVLPSTPRQGVPCAALCCQHQVDVMPMGRLFLYGAAVTPGFLPLHYYFSCLFYTSFQANSIFVSKASPNALHPPL